jgi:NADP-dependent aldehyde dehydrogenase
MTLLGTSFIGYSRSTGTEPFLRASQAGSGAALEPLFVSATADEVDQALALAAAAFPVFSNLSGKKRAEFLRAAATEIEGAVEDIVARGMLETALPEARLRGETGRTTGQLRLFANLIEEGSWVDASRA